jgi:hypothetical protein
MATDGAGYYFGKGGEWRGVLMFLVVTIVNTSLYMA